MSSLSWYFLVTFGLNGVYRLLLGGQGDLDENQMMQMQVRACLPACLPATLLLVCVHVLTRAAGADGNDGPGTRRASDVRRSCRLQVSCIAVCPSLCLPVRACI